MTHINFAIIVFVFTLLGSLAALFLKLSHQGSRLFFILGGGLYFFSALINIYLLKNHPISLILPLTSLTYIWTLILARVILKEKLRCMKILGIFSIGIGIYFLS